MKHLRMVAVALVALSLLATSALASKKEDTKRLPGTWAFDVMEMVKAHMGGAVPEGMEAMFKDKYMHITFHKDGTYAIDENMNGGEANEKGTWKIVDSEEKGVLMVETTSADGEVQTAAIRFQDDDSFEATLGEDVMKATRVQKKAEKEMEKAESGK